MLGLSLSARPPRRPPPRPFRLVSPWLALAALVTLAPGLEAQSGFLFGRPAAHLDFFGGVSVPRAGSEVFDWTIEELMMERSDFRSAVYGGSIGYRVTERVDLAAELGYSRATTETEYEHYVGTDDLPIVQSTRFTRLPLSLIVRGYLWERGRSVGSLTWIPASWTPYAGVGLGVTWYDFAREGEFVDFATLDIVYDRVTWDGAAPTGHLLGGVEFTLSPRFLLLGEGRFTWASDDDRARDFEDFDAMDLSGFQAIVGISVRL